MGKRRAKQKLPDIDTFYQPLFSVDGSRIIGYEALTRGRRAGSRLPEELYRKAYSNGTTISLDFRCLNNAFRILPKLERSQLLFVNVEPITLGYAFRTGNKADALLQRLRTYRKQIVFELTERIRVWDIKFVQTGVLFLKKKGYRFALDDVAGLDSELINLFTLKPNFLKIDMSLVRGIAKNRLKQGFFRKLVAYGRRKKVPMIAEGIERKADFSFVRRYPLMMLQGFYLGRPRKKLPGKTLFKR